MAIKESLIDFISHYCYKKSLTTTTVVLCGMDVSKWKNYRDLFLEGLTQAMLSEGYTQQEIEG